MVNEYNKQEDFKEVSIEYNFINNKVRRGQIWKADMSCALGSEQSGERYILIIGNDLGNMHSPCVETCAITSQNKPGLPTHVELEGILPRRSIIMTEQKRTIDKMRLISYKCKLSDEVMEQVNKALRISLALQ